MKKTSLLVALLGTACGGAPPSPVVKPPVVPEPTGPRPAQRYQITIVGGSVDGHKPDGTAWDAESTPAPPELRGALAGYLAAHPELEGASHLIGEPVDVPGVQRSARASSAPDPMVFVEIEGKVFRTTLAPGQFQPVWRFPLLVSASPDSTQLARITVVDWDGPGQVDIIGDKLVPVKTLVAEPLTELPRFGNVEKLVVEVAPAPELAGKHRVAVAGRDGWTDAGLPLVAGEEVTVRAAGEVCTRGASDRAHCAGPEGQGRPEAANLPGFEARGHGALVGAVGDTRFFLGREMRFTAPSSGPLLLDVNDGDPGNNSGELEVLIETR